MKKDKPFLISSYESSSIFRSLTNSFDVHIPSCDPSGNYMEASLNWRKWVLTQEMENSCSTVYYQYCWKWKEWGTLVLTFVKQIDDCVNTNGKKIEQKNGSNSRLCAQGAGRIFVRLKTRDQFRFLGNCPPTPPLTPHFVPSETKMFTFR